MRSMPYLIQHTSGVFYAQRKVPERLQVSAARVTKSTRPRLVFLKQSLGTKDQKQANIGIKPVLIDFDRIIREAEALENSKPSIRSTLTAAEISRMAEYVYAKVLQDDERIRVGGRDEYARITEGARGEYRAEGRNPDEFVPLWRYEDLPKYGLSAAQLALSRKYLAEDLEYMRNALALSNISAVEHHVADALEAFGINLDPNSRSYLALGIAVLRSYVRALEDVGKRDDGHPIETPALSAPLSSPVASGASLREALEGWKKEKVRAEDGVHEYIRTRGAIWWRSSEPRLRRAIQPRFDGRESYKRNFRDVRWRRQRSE
jgi:hypothetical protein